MVFFSENHRISCLLNMSRKVINNCRQIHDALSIEDTASIQRILFPLSREKLIELDKSYRKKYGVSFADSPVLKTDPIWGMFFSENLPKQQLQRFLNQVHINWGIGFNFMIKFTGPQLLILYCYTIICFSGGELAHFAIISRLSSHFDRSHLSELLYINFIKPYCIYN